MYVNGNDSLREKLKIQGVGIFGNTSFRRHVLCRHIDIYILNNFLKTVLEINYQSVETFSPFYTQLTKYEHICDFNLLESCCLPGFALTEVMCLTTCTSVTALAQALANRERLMASE